MRSFCVFVNKILNLEEARQKTSDCDLSDSCLLKFSSTDIIDHDVVLPRLRFIEVEHNILVDFSFLYCMLLYLVHRAYTWKWISPGPMCKCVKLSFVSGAFRFLMLNNYPIGIVVLPVFWWFYKQLASTTAACMHWKISATQGGEPHLLYRISWIFLVYESLLGKKFVSCLINFHSTPFHLWW